MIMTLEKFPKGQRMAKTTEGIILKTLAYIVFLVGLFVCGATLYATIAVTPTWNAVNVNSTRYLNKLYQILLNSYLSIKIIFNKFNFLQFFSVV